jgi:predicted secreted Zn-dependent protease
MKKSQNWKGFLSGLKIHEMVHCQICQQFLAAQCGMKFIATQETAWAALVPGITIVIISQLEGA